VNSFDLNSSLLSTNEAGYSTDDKSTGIVTGQLYCSSRVVENLSGCLSPIEETNQMTLHVLQASILYQGKEFIDDYLFGMEQGHSDVHNDEEDCVICLSSERSVALLPCRHLCMCGDCASYFKDQSTICPICRSYVSALVNSKTN